jgi:hypothetical protein
MNKLEKTQQDRFVEIPNNLVGKLLNILDKLAKEKKEPTELSYKTTPEEEPWPYWDGDRTYTDLFDELYESWEKADFGITNDDYDDA